VEQRKLSDHEQMQDAQSRCVPCKLCGGQAIISDAGEGAGYYVACSNSQSFKEANGCLISLRRLGGWAYNVMGWWNRLHSIEDDTPTDAGEKHGDDFHVEYDESDDDFTICWPDGRYLVAHRSGNLVVGRSPQSLGIAPIGLALDSLYARPAPTDTGEGIAPWKCLARKQTLPEPADCNWPVCGCDPAANKVLEALEESGLIPTPTNTSLVGELIEGRERQAVRDAIFSFQCTNWDAGAMHDLSEEVWSALSKAKDTPHG